MIARVALCAQDAARDADTNRISAFNIYDGIISEAFPLLLQNFVFLVILARDEGDETPYQGRVEIRLGDNVLVQGAAPIDFQGKRRVRQFIRLGGLVVPTAGTISARFFANDIQLAEYQFEIEQRQPTLPQVEFKPA